MDEISEFISVLNAECEVLKKKGIVPVSVSEPWRYYSPPLDDEHEYEHLRAVLEAGKLAVEAETCTKTGDDAGAWCALAKAQQALLKALSARGRRIAKKIGQAKGGQGRDENLRHTVLCIADHLLESGQKERGLAAQVAIELSKEGLEMREDNIRKILKEL